MIKQKKLLAVHLNEFNYNFLKYGSKKYNLKFIKKLVELKRITTFTVDKIQNENLDPWVQSVSINTGKRSRKHKVFKLGQKINQKLSFIWDILAKKNIDCFVWGSINSKFTQNKNIKLFFPDPWNYISNPYPKNLDNLHKLPRYYAKNYLELKKTKIIKHSIIFLYSMIKNNGISFFFKNFFLISNSILKKGLSNYILFFIFDIISLCLFKKKIYSKKNCFSYIFVNSLAHFQHNNWDDKSAEKFYFIYVDRIAKYIFEILSQHNSLLIFNGFSQDRVRNMYLIRPTNPEKFLKKIISFKKIEQDMTNGGYIFFNNRLNTNKAIKILENYQVCGFKIFKVSQKKKNSLFYRINIKSKKNLKVVKLTLINEGFLRNNILAENSINDHQIKFNKAQLINFLNDIHFIKSTGVHAPSGDALFQNIPEMNKIKKIENHKIFNIIENYYNKKQINEN